jgi:hypothetical protein
MKKTIVRRLREAAHLLYECEEEMRANERVYSEDDFDRLAGLASQVADMADRAAEAVSWPAAEGACSECGGSGDHDKNTAGECSRCLGTGVEPSDGG